MGRSSIQPAATRQTAEKLLKALRKAEAIQGIPLKRGITQTLFGRLVAGCLVQYLDTRDNLIRIKQDFGPDSKLQTRSIRSALKLVAALGWPPLTKEATLLLTLDERLRKLGEPYIKNIQDRLHMLDPVVCLYVLFRYLVRLNRRQPLEWYEQVYFPRILGAAGITTPRGKMWTAANIQRRLRRVGGEAHARRVAGVMLSINPATKRYRPVPTFKENVSTSQGEYYLALKSRHLYLPDDLP